MAQTPSPQFPPMQPKSSPQPCSQPPNPFPNPKTHSTALPWGEGGGGAVASPALHEHRNLCIGPPSAPGHQLGVPYPQQGLLCLVLSSAPLHPFLPPPPSHARAWRKSRGGRAAALGCPWGRAMGSSRWEIPCGKGMCLFLTSCTVCLQPQAQQTATITLTSPHPHPFPSPPLHANSYQNHASYT